MGVKVDTARLTILIKGGRYRRLPKGQMLQTTDTNQSVCLVKKGYIKRYIITNEGTTSIQGIYGPGYIFPLTYVYKKLFEQQLYSGPETIYYQAMTNVEIYNLDGDRLVEAAEADPAIYKELLSVAGRRFHSNIQQLENLSLKDYYHRVAHQLLYFAREFGVEVPEGVCIKLPLTHQDIADVLSTSRETVSICLGLLRSKKLIKTGRQIIVPNMSNLRDEAYS
jgi:CRP/FNR family transcriptional regulator, cyclic AMP receptor protein